MCLNPRLIRLPNGYSRYVPCGHCLQCLKSYQDSWTARLNEELKQWKDVDGSKPCVFFTLDYRPESVPCTYLIVSRTGVKFSDSCPINCSVFPFWTDTTHETKRDWLKRRKKLLTLYWRYVNLAFSNQDRVATLDDFLCGNVMHTDKWKFHIDDLPEFDPDFFSFSPNGLEHPVQKFDVIRDFSQDDSDNLIAFEFHSVSKPDVQGWLKRCRRKLEYYLPDVFAQEVNPRLVSTWKSPDGELPLPSSSVTPTFKYFITSEYGPKTFRPHYHGVVFGVTYEEFEKYFVSDWRKNFGNVDFSLLRLTGGAMLYVSKYCAKGEYEHPYCKKDYFYNDAEFHSRHYEDSILDFGLDLPLVRPTFHLLSKGLGLYYCFNQEIQDYFGVHLALYLTACGSKRYASFDKSVFIPSGNLKELFPIDSSGASLFRSFDLKYTDDSIVINKYVDAEHRYLLSSSSVSYDSVVNTALEQLYFNKKYTRTYVTFKTFTSACRGNKWQFGDSRGKLETRTTSIPLPRYYSKTLVSPLVSLFRQALASKLFTDWHVSIARLIQQQGYSDEVLSKSFSLRNHAEVMQAFSHSRLRSSAEYFIRQSKF